MYGNTLPRMHFSFCIAKATNICSEYVILPAFPLQNGCMKDPQCYAIRTWHVLLNLCAYYKAREITQSFQCLTLEIRLPIRKRNLSSPWRLWSSLDSFRPVFNSDPLWTHRALYSILTFSGPIQPCIQFWPSLDPFSLVFNSHRLWTHTILYSILYLSGPIQPCIQFWPSLNPHSLYSILTLSATPQPCIQFWPSLDPQSPVLNSGPLWTHSALYSILSLFGPTQPYIEFWPSLDPQITVFNSGPLWIHTSLYSIMNLSGHTQPCVQFWSPLDPLSPVFNCCHPSWSACKAG